MGVEGDTSMGIRGQQERTLPGGMGDRKGQEIEWREESGRKVAEKTEQQGQWPELRVKGGSGEPEGGGGLSPRR